MSTSIQKRSGSEDMSTSSYLDKLNGMMQRVFAATQAQIDNLPEGQKINIKQLTEKVADFLSMPQAQVAQFVAMFIRSYDKCTVQKGRNGGIYRGSIPKKLEEPRCMACGQKLRKRSDPKSPDSDAKAA